MGTGIVSILLYNLPYNAPWVRYISYGFFVLNVALFCLFSTTTLLRYVLYPEIWAVMIRHPGMSLFLGCIPMGLASTAVILLTPPPLPTPSRGMQAVLTAFRAIINMTVYVCASWGDRAVYLAWTLWWVDVVVSLSCCLTIPFIV